MSNDNLKVEKVSIETRALKGKKTTKDLCIFFTSNESFPMRTYLSLVVPDTNQNCYFQVSEVVFDGVYKYVAREIGYFKYKFHKNRDDIGILKDLFVNIITDEEQIQKINEQSCWC